jgi:uncharacterized protein YyaL (SSP411 family)
MSRRTFAVGMGAVGLAALTGAGGAAAAPARAVSDAWARRAHSSYAALQRFLYLPDSGLYQENYPTQDGENPYSYVWPLREAAAATQDVNQLARTRYDGDVVSRFDALERYFNEERGSYDSYAPPPLGTGGDPFYDDNGVIGLELVRRYRLAGERRMLDRAARTFDFVEQAWDTDTTVDCPGGMHWVDADWNPYRGGTNVTGIASELAAHLYELTGRRRYLGWAERTHEWVYGCMRREPGLYRNGVLLDGTVEETLWTYNSGFMIGAATLLHRATGRRSWLRTAEEDADGALAYWDADRLYGQPAVFNAIYLANLLLFSSEQPDRSREIVEQFTGYAERLWAENRDAGTGLFGFQASGGGAPDPALRPQTLHQSGVTQIFALLAWRRTDWRSAT